MLYVLAKFKYTPGNDIRDGKNPFLKACTSLLLAEPVLSVDQACRNLWNFYALDHYDPKLFDKLGEVIVKHHDKL